MYMMVLHCNALVRTMYKLSYIGPHQQLAPLCGPYSMALAYSCNDSGTSVHQIDSPRWCHVHQLLICTPASQSGPKLQVLASLPSHSEIYPEFNVGLFDSETIETGTFPTKSAFYLMNFVLLNYCCQDLIFLTSLGKIDESQCPSCSETSNVPVTECYRVLHPQSCHCVTSTVLTPPPATTLPLCQLRECIHPMEIKTSPASNHLK